MEMELNMMALEVLYYYHEFILYNCKLNFSFFICFFSNMFCVHICLYLQIFFLSYGRYECCSINVLTGEFESCVLYVSVYMCLQLPGHGICGRRCLVDYLCVFDGT